MRFSLRALILAMTLIAVYLGFYAYSRNSQQRFVTGSNWALRDAPDSRTIAELVRKRVGALPSHRFTDERLFELADQFFPVG